MTIPEGVTSIGNCSFRLCRSLTSVTIPDGVTSIGDWTFRNCSSLESVTIPESVTNIGNCAFVDCYSLRTICSKRFVPCIAGGESFLGVPSDAVVYVPIGSKALYKFDGS